MLGFPRNIIFIIVCFPFFASLRLIFVISENTKNTNNITGVAVVYIVLTIVATLAIMENKKYFYKKIGLDKV